MSDVMQYGFAAVSLVLLAPLCLIIGLVSKFTSPGPILHRGLRVGKDGRIFTIYNFRTLTGWRCGEDRRPAPDRPPHQISRWGRPVGPAC